MGSRVKIAGRLLRIGHRIAGEGLLRQPARQTVRPTSIQKKPQSNPQVEIADNGASAFTEMR